MELITASASTLNYTRTSATSQSTIPGSCPWLTSAMLEWEHHLLLRSDASKPLIQKILEEFSSNDGSILHRLEAESNPAVHTRGRIVRTSTGGGQHSEEVDVSRHFHSGHPKTLKVRPALGLSLVTEPPHEGHHGQTKLGPRIREPPQFPFISKPPSSLKAKPSAPTLVLVPLDARDVATGKAEAKHECPTPVNVEQNPEPSRDFDAVDEVEIPIKDELKSYWGFSTPVNNSATPNISDSRVENRPDATIRPAGPPDENDPACVYAEPAEDQLVVDKNGQPMEGADNDAVELLPKAQQAVDSDQSWIYTRTSRWLKDLLNHAEPYSSKLTGAPRRSTLHDLPLCSRQNTVLTRTGSTKSDRRKSSLAPRDLTRRSTVRTAHSVDTRYKSTVKDLENILNSAVELAKEAVEHFEIHPWDKLDDNESMPGTYPETEGRELQFTHVRGTAHDHAHANLVNESRRHDTSTTSGNIIVPVPQRISSLLKLNERLDSSNSSSKTSSDKEARLLFPVSAHEPMSSIVSRCVSSLKLKPDTPSSRPFSGQKSSVHSYVDSLSMDGVPTDDPTLSSQCSGAKPADNSGKGKPSRGLRKAQTAPVMGPDEDIELQDLDPRGPSQRPGLSLRGRSHVSLRGVQAFSLARSHRRQPIARDWSDVRKRFVASVACLSTALIGVLVGIYAGLVPSIQYWIADLSHYAILGNVFFYLGLAIPSFFFWPLPLLHGRKPYILSSLVLAMPLLFPQAIAVSDHRSPYTNTWRWALLGSRAFMGFVLGFSTMNFQATLTDLFGASLMSGNPHQEVVDKYDVRRHGGGMGVWMGIWTFSFTGSIGIGFLIGAAVINDLNPAWGFYISIVIICVVLILNVFCPEVRRSAYRRSVAEVRTGTEVSRRVARGEIMMHRVKDGPKWWGEEVWHGILLSLEMLRQPGFAVMAVYTGWIYAQIVLIIVLLGSLTSKYYMLESPLVGTCVFFVSLGALIAVPFQKANIFSRGRHHQDLSMAEPTEKKVTWTSHFLRRTIFCIGLPLAGIAYALSSYGPPVPVAIPVLFATMVGILSGLALSECHGLIMETWDTSDLQPGMTGRPRSNSKTPKRTNYSSFPRVTAAFACCHMFSFIFAAGATALGGRVQRNLGQRTATGIVAGILLVLTLLLLAVFIRFKTVQIIPQSKAPEMDKWHEVRRESIIRRRSIADPRIANPGHLIDDEMWRPLIIGNPSDKKRRINILELGHMTRWTEIRKRNKLIDESATEHPNLAALGSAVDAAAGGAAELGARGIGLVRKVSERSQSRRYHSASPKVSDKFEQRPPSAGLPDHRHTPGAGGECVMDQTVREESEMGSDEEEIFSTPFDRRDRVHELDATSSQMAQSAIERQQAEHASHTGISKVQNF